MTQLNGAANLYAALRDAGAAGVPLSDLLAACDAQTAARLASIDRLLLAAIHANAAGRPAIATALALRDWLKHVAVAPVFLPTLAQSRTLALLTGDQLPEMPAFSDRAFDAWFAAQGVDYALGAYGEHRSVYETAQFADAASPERRTVHLGIDVFAAKGTPVHAPLAGQVVTATYNPDPLDYGHTLILRHDGGPAPVFTLYGHLGPLPVAVGDWVTAGQPMARLGDWHENGGWAPHLHFQIMTSLLDQSGNFFGVGHASLWDVWSDICPDPNLILRLDPARYSCGA